MTLCKKHLGTTLAVLAAIWFVVCFIWGFIIPVDIRPLHADLLKMSVLGWSGMNVTSFLLGIFQWAIWGWLIGWSFMLVGKSCAKSCSVKSK